MLVFKLWVVFLIKNLFLLYIVILVVVGKVFVGKVVFVIFKLMRLLLLFIEVGLGL